MRGHEANQLRQVGMRILHLHSASFEFGHVQQVTHVPIQQPGVTLHHLHFLPFIGIQVRSGQSFPYRAEDQGQGRAQLVANVRKEPCLHFVQLAGSLVELGDLIVCGAQLIVSGSDGDQRLGRLLMRLALVIVGESE
ncbi:hypothetical protein SDC9_205964 [bioreactor metagenome]|uniref:Uncharacterized protein n=1 Tax=bioreactor metagenome TaxID=1076179 RepID=A0A645J3Q1_9ZZZZ